MAKKTILVTTANPDDSGNLRTDRFVRSIQEGLKEAEKTEAFEVKTELASDWANLLKAIEKVRPDILHLVGHGDHLEQFVFETTDGKREYADPEALAKDIGLYADKIACVVISACHSKDLAQAIVRQGVNYAVGYDDELDINVAKKYCQEFYFYLARGNTYPEVSQKTIGAMDKTIDANQIPQLFVKEIVATLKENQVSTQFNNDMSKDGIRTLMEDGKVDQAFEQFLAMAKGSETYNNFLMSLNQDYKEYKKDKLAGKDVRGKLADITQRFMNILDMYE